MKLHSEPKGESRCEWAPLKLVRGAHQQGALTYLSESGGCD